MEEVQVKSKRIHDIEQYIRLKKKVSLDELCEVFNVSKNTIRRDITKIVEQDDYRKVYGGVEFVRNYLLPFEERNQRAEEGKKQIAKRAAKEIQNKDIIFIDSGTTTQYIPDFLHENIELTILTNSLNIINKSSKFPNVVLIVVGEIFKRKTNSFVGIEDSKVLNKYNIHKAFMAATAASIESGLTNSDNQEYEIKRKIVEKSGVSYALLDYDKFGKSALVTYAELNQIDGIICDQNIPTDYQEFAEQNNIKVLLP